MCPPLVTVPHCLRQETLLFLEAACREVIAPCQDLQGDPDKQPCPAIGDPALTHGLSPGLLPPLGDRNRGSITHIPPRPVQAMAGGGTR